MIMDLRSESERYYESLWHDFVKGKKSFCEKASEISGYLETPSSLARTQK